MGLLLGTGAIPATHPKAHMIGRYTTGLHRMSTLLSHYSLPFRSRGTVPFRLRPFGGMTDTDRSHYSGSEQPVDHRIRESVRHDGHPDYAPSVPSSCHSSDIRNRPDSVLAHERPTTSRRTLLPLPATDDDSRPSSFRISTRTDTGGSRIARVANHALLRTVTIQNSSHSAHSRIPCGRYHGFHAVASR